MQLITHRIFAACHFYIILIGGNGGLKGKFPPLSVLKNCKLSEHAVISTNESTEFRTGHVIYNPVYTYKFQLKTTIMGVQ